MSATRLAARQAISEALRNGEKVRLSHFSRWRCGLGALLLAIAISIHVGDVIQDRYPWYSAAAIVLVSLLGIWVFAFAWGSDRNAAVQCTERAMLVWDWRGRQSSVPYEGIQAVRAGRSWDWWSISVRKHAEGEDSAWREVICYPTSTGWLITAIAAQFAARCGLAERSNGLWARSALDEPQ